MTSIWPARASNRSRAARAGPVLLAALVAASPALALAAGGKPLWELGLGLGALSFPDYRGADRRQTYLLPVPYLVYRGDFLRADRQGLRGVLLAGERAELNLSLSGWIPVDSDGNRARAGMPDLRPTLELGPSLDLLLWQSGSGGRNFDLRLPLRWLVPVGGRPREVGVVFGPRLRLRLHDIAGLPGWTFGLQAGPDVADRRANAYYYGVAAAFETAQRPAYAAPAGYAGSQLLVSASKRFASVWVGAFARVDSLHGAAFADSPLLRRDSAWMAGLAVSWIIAESARRTDASD